MTESSQGPETGYEKVAEESPIILDELTGHDCKTDSEFLKDMFIKKVASIEEINLFLATTDLYDNTEKRWTKVPDTPKLEKELYEPMCDIFKAILDHFGYSSTRTVIDSHATALTHVEGNERLASTSTPLKSSPDITIKGRGPNFGPNLKSRKKLRNKTKKDEDETATKKDFPDYHSCVSHCEHKTESNRNYPHDLAQTGVYVRWVIDYLYEFCSLD